MSAQWRVFLAAVQYFTRLPVPASVGHSQQLLDDAARYFPAVGTLVGVASAATFFVGSLLLPPTVAALLAVSAAVWITGAFHEDGLADAIDGIGGGYERQRILEIMRDSRIGTYGAVALLLSIGLRVSILAALPVDLGCLLLIVGHTCSRHAGIVLMWLLPYVREDESRAKPLSRSLSLNAMLVASSTALAAFALGVAYDPALLGGLPLALVAQLYWYRVLRRNLQGYTGDCLGAAQQITEVSLGVGLLAAWSI